MIMPVRLYCGRQNRVSSSLFIVVCLTLHRRPAAGSQRELTNMSRLAAESSKIFPPDFASVDAQAVFARVSR